MEMIMMYVVGPAMTIAGTVIAYFQGRKKSTAETKTVELQNKRTEIEIYQDTISNFDTLLKVRDGAIDEMKKQMDTIIEQNSNLLIQNNDLIKQNRELIKKVNALEKDLKEFQKKEN